MSNNNNIDLIDELRIFLERLGIENPPIINRALKDYKIYLDPPTPAGSPKSYLSLEDIEEISKKRDLDRELFKKVKINKDKPISVDPHRSISYTLPLAIVWEFLPYLESKRFIIEKYKETKDWSSVYCSVVYSDEDISNEAFIDCLEEIEGVKIKDVKQLSKITGLTHLVPTDWEEGKDCPDKISKQFALKDLGDCLLTARLNKYKRAIEKAIQTGAKYKDLLEIKPKDWDLPESWEGSFSSHNQREAIIMSIYFVFFFEVRLSFTSPSLRRIAEDLEAPLEIIIEAYNKKR
jgi:hypothetical protein